jgi:formylglycine-generating enzyme required for sulfatase activity
MRKASRFHVVRGLVIAAILVLVIRGVMELWLLANVHLLVDALKSTDTAQLPQMLVPIEQVEHGPSFPSRMLLLSGLRRMYAESEPGSRERLHASLALLPVDETQVDYLYGRLLDAKPNEVPVIRDALAPYKEQLLDKLWAVVESPEKGQESQRLRAAAALAKYDPESENWAKAQEAVGNDLVGVPAVYSSWWVDSLRPVRSQLLPQLSVVYRNAKRRETERALATEILADYAADQPQVLADLLMDADAKQFSVLFPKVKETDASGAKPLLAELDRQPRPTRSDPPLSRSWKEPEAEVRRRIEAAHGLLHERFAFCQTMPLAEFLKLADDLRPSGYRPIRVRPYAAARGVQVAAVWTRDGQEWQMVCGLSKEQMARHDSELQKRGYVPDDVAGYMSQGLHFGAIWVAANDQGVIRRQSIGVPKAEHQGDFDRLVNQGFRPLTIQAVAQDDGTPVISQIYSKARAESVGSVDWEQRISINERRLLGLAAHGLLVDASFMPSEGAQLSYGGIRYTSTGFTSVAILGTDDTEHLARGRVLIADGYRPASMEVRWFGLNQPKVVASIWHRPVLTEDDKEKLAKRQANAAVALLRLNQPEKVWPLLKHGPDPRARSYLIHRFGPLVADAGAIVERLAEEPDVTTRRALILSLGPEEFGEQAWSPEGKKQLVKQLQELYRTADDPGLHAAAEWLLRQWKKDAWLRQVNDEWAKDKEQRDIRQNRIQQSIGKEKEKTPPQWYVNGQGQTMVVIAGPVEFMMGSPETQQGRLPGETQHKRRIGRTFALAAKAVTVEQYRKFDAGYDIKEIKRWVQSVDSPVVSTSWFEAAMYCNWLSWHEGLPENEWCYESVVDLKVLRATRSIGLLAGSLGPLGATGGLLAEPNGPQYIGGMKLARNYLHRTGYRLPTEAEMEYATRAEAATSFYFGETEELLDKYAWYLKNSLERTWPVGSKKPNDLGLFDLHGNVNSWCQESWKPYPQSRQGEAINDVEDIVTIDLQENRMLRGGSFLAPAPSVRSAYRYGYQPNRHDLVIGFRLARTLR